jgi:hypothetical protein
MADQNINYKITVDVESGTASLRDLQGRIVANQVPIQELRKEFGNFVTTVNSSDFNKFKSGLDKVAKSQQTFQNSMKQTSDKTGAATSSVLELGRVIQDAPYGIRGMANNITQLVSQVAFATKAAGSFSGALKQMWAAMMGPLGVVFAISAVVSILDGLYGGQKKAKEATEETTEALKDQDDILIKIASSYLKFGKNKELNDYYSRALIQRSPKLKKILEDENKSQEEKNKAISDFVKLKELEIDNENRLIKVKELKVSLDEKEKEIRDKYSKDLAGARGTKAEANLIKKINKEISDSTMNTRNSIEESLSDYIAFSSEIQRLESILFPKEEKTKVIKVEKVSPFKTGKELDIDIKSNEEALLKYNRDILLQNLRNQEALEISTAKSENEKNNIRLRYAKRIAEANIKFEYEDLERRKKTEQIVAKEKYNTFKVEAELRLESYIDSINKNKKLSKAQRDSAIASATSDTKALLSGANVELQSSLSEIESKYEPMFALLDSLHKARLDAFGVTNQDTELQKITKYVNAYQSIMGSILPFIQGEFERQKVVEQNKTNALNEELNNRLLNEELSKNERARIQNEIAQNDEALRKKKEIIEKKQFQITKMANIAGALVQTYSGAMAAYWNTLQNPINKLLPDGGLLRAKINAGIATGAGLLQVAAIARQKFQSSASSAPVRGGGGGGSGGGMADRSFNFNLVGNNRENQLANAIQGQFNQPLKAYVVSRDMSNQQQLDANIVDSARF